MNTDTPLPPGLQKQTIERIPADLREDAIQEAWLAHLEGKNPGWAVRRYVRREAQYRRTHTSLSDDQASELTEDARRHGGGG